jgi:hypothetical protein
MASEMGSFPEISSPIFIYKSSVLPTQITITHRQQDLVEIKRILPDRK